MIDDASNGKISLILTKEVSRFARNTVDTLKYTRALKEKNVYVHFTLDAIHTEDADGEFKLTMMASLAQEESRKTSERVKWGQKRQMEKGVVFGRDMLGYDVRNGNLSLNEDGAQIVRAIFYKYTIEGKGTHVIGRELTEAGIFPLNPNRIANAERSWNASVILKILRNEKYVGDLLQQKTFTPDFLSHGKKYNNGECDFIYIKDHHPDIAIVDRDLWDKTQIMLTQRKVTDEQRVKYSTRYWTSGIIFCGECGSSYIHSSIKRKDGSSYSTLRCFAANNFGNQRTINGKTVGCNSFMVNGQVLSYCVDRILTLLRKNKNRLIESMKKEIEYVLSVSTPIDNKKVIQKNIFTLEQKVNKLIDLVLDGSISKSEMVTSKKGYTEKIDILKQQLYNIEQEEVTNQDEANRIEKCISEIKRIMSFDDTYEREYVYKAIVKKIVVYNDKTLYFYLYCIDKPIKIKYSTYGRMSGYTVNIESLELLEK